jgi:hypothetical protein
LSLEHLEDRLTPATFNAVDVPNLIADIILANGNGTANTINLTPNDYLLNRVDNSNDFAGNNGLPVITSPFLLTINGNGATIERDSSSLDFRLFAVDPAARLSLNNVTLAFGLVNYFGAQGGAIVNAGTLTLSHDAIRDNEALGISFIGGSESAGGSATGGGIYNTVGASLTMTACTLSGNMAQGGNGGFHSAGTIHDGEPGGFAGGGGIANDGSIIISACLLDGNVATGGNGGAGSGNGANGGAGGEAVGGGVVSTGTITILNSTISNSAAIAGHVGNGGPGAPGGDGGIVQGGGLFNLGGALTLVSTTIAQNEVVPGLGGSGGAGASAGNPGAASGGGIRAASAVAVKNTIVAGNLRKHPFFVIPSAVSGPWHTNRRSATRISSS